MINRIDPGAGSVKRRAVRIGDFQFQQGRGKNRAGPLVRSRTNCSCLFERLMVVLRRELPDDFPVLLKLEPKNRMINFKGGGPEPVNR
jgi:hypothetical protein